MLIPNLKNQMGLWYRVFHYKERRGYKMNLKKAELHVHLEGTITPTLAAKLAKRNNLSMPEGLVAPDGVSYLSNDFLHFLTVYDTLAALIKTPQDYYDI